MEMILVYLAVAALVASITGLFIPKKIVFWCRPNDRNRAMAFTVYLTLAVVLVIAFIVVVPEPPPAPIPAPEPAPVAPIVQAKPKPAPLTQAVFFKEVKKRLAKTPDFTMENVTLSLLYFGKKGATAQVKFSNRPKHIEAVEHGTHAVEAMVATLEAHGWKLADPIMVTCQVHAINTDSSEDKQAYRSIGIARYKPESQKTTWLDYK